MRALSKRIRPWCSLMGLQWLQASIVLIKEVGHGWFSYIAICLG